MDGILKMKYSITQLKYMGLIAHYHIKYHKDKQIIQAIQELAELTKELTKYHFKDDITYELLEELFDADMMIFQLKKILVEKTNNFERYNHIVNEKINREMKRYGLTSN